MGRLILSGVPPVASCSCVRASSRGEEHLPAWHQRSAPHEIRITGEPCHGRGVPGGSQGTRTTACAHCSGVAKGATHGHRSFQCGAGRACHRPHNGGAPNGNSIARRSTPCQAASVRGQSNQVLSEVLRAGRESTAGLSPLSTPDSILMCYQILRERARHAGTSSMYGWTVL